MEKKTLEILFTNKRFWIPDYQRDYAWRSENVADLLEDLRESIETSTPHYIGTFILSKINVQRAEAIISTALQGTVPDDTCSDVAKKAAPSIYSLVDGQQRLTTLSMILHTLVASLPNTDPFHVICKDRFLNADGVPKVLLQSNNHDFYHRLLANPDGAKPRTRGQRLMAKAQADITRYAQALVKNGLHAIRSWLEVIKKLEVLEFIEEDEGRAIRIFQTVNDRGVPLTNMDKAKSLLVYYSNRFLGGKLDHTINQCFGEAYRAYDAIKEVVEASDYPVGLIINRSFNEDSILRWHFVSWKSDKWTYDATEQYVLDTFLRPELKTLRDKGDSLQKFIEDYVSDVQEFFLCLQSVLERTKVEPEYYKLFVLLGPSTYLYPLIVRLAQMGLLDQQAPTEAHFTFRYLVEIADVRIYKTRGTDPSKAVTTLAREVKTLTPHQIATKLREIVMWFMPDTEFEKRLRQDMYGNQALVRMLVAVDERLLRTRGNSLYCLQQLIELRRAEPTIEHVFSQQPRFDFPGHHFESAEEYTERNNKLGNLLILEKRLNSRCSNSTVGEKLSHSNLYAESKFECVQQFLQDCRANDGFTISELDIRTDQLAKTCLTEWPIWNIGTAAESEEGSECEIQRGDA